MMTIVTLKRLIISNFKGIKDLTVDLNAGETNIYGRNGSGKSTVFDAFLFLLFGKDSMDRKDFDIKNTVHLELNRDDHEVIGVLSVNGKEEVLKHIYREKWVKKQGSEHREMNGHEHVYFWNDVPLSAGEYKAKVDGILQESIFKLLTNALYFNQMKWSERRKILFDIAGEIYDNEVIDALTTVQNKGEYVNLLNVLNSGKTIEEYKKQLAAKKKAIKVSLDEIGPRIAENLRNLPEEIDFSAIENHIHEKNAQLTDIENIINDRVSAHQSVINGIQVKQNQLHKLIQEQNSRRFSIQQEIQNEQNQIKNSIFSLKNKVDSLEENIKSKKVLIQGKKDRNEKIQMEMEDLRAGWAKDKARKFDYDESQFSCPTCNRDFETDDIEAAKATMRENFDKETARLLEIVNAKGTLLKSELEENNQLIQSVESAVAGLETELAEAKESHEKANQPSIDINQAVEERLKNHAEYSQAAEVIKSLQAEIDSSDKPEIDLTDLKDKKDLIVSEVDTLKKQLNIKEQIDQTNKRIDQLKAEETSLAQQLAQVEGSEFAIEEFTKAKVDKVEERINSKFKYVTFKMFNNLINGGAEETCVTMYKGVPWDVLNTAGRLNAGIDIINTLSEHYGSRAPIICDNRESVTNLIDTESQLINLIVSPADEALRIE